MKIAYIALSLLGAVAFAPTLSLAQTITNPNYITRVSSFEYNNQGLLSKEVIEPDNVQSCLTTTHGYDHFGNKTSITTSACPGAWGDSVSSSSASRTATTTYTASGHFPAVATNALGHSETKLYHPHFGSVTRLDGPNGLATVWYYDSFGRKDRELRSDNTFTAWQYLYCTTDYGANCPSSLVAQGDGAYLGGSPVAAQIPVYVVVERTYNSSTYQEISAYKRQYYDSLNRVIRVETQGFDGGSAPPIVQVQDTAYNHLGQVARKSNVYDRALPHTAVWVGYTYDVLGRPIKDEAPDSTASSTGGVAVTQVSYNGLSVTTTNSKGQTKTTVKDSLGRNSSVTDTQGNIVSYQYDALGQLIQTNSAGSITKIAYNIRGQKVRMDDPAMGVWDYAYNVFGELVRQTDSLTRVSTMEYDRLGRMIRRNEPDLISVWTYDTCSKGIGKLCRASTLTGTGAIDYDRQHTYDSLGRPWITNTKLDTTVTTVTSYDTLTGRVARQGYPTGYSVSYQYTALGFLKTVTGQGNSSTPSGITPQARYEILAVNAQNQITSYRYGNQIVTNKTFDPKTGRLQAITATKDGLVVGGIQQTTYQYDSLSNLTARADINTGVQESFLYDNLNRLTNYTATGGSVTSSDSNANVQVQYDPRGNILYKSDVGRYWYDPQRPNRVNQITLEAPVGAAALTGTRALSYAFDDQVAGARTLTTGLGAASGVVMGNGNLVYTVTQDNATGRHSVRWETYTSFNMPKELALNNLAAPAPSTAAVNNTCPLGFTLASSRCYANMVMGSMITNRKLTFTYGPEHQRVSQRTQLDATAPTNMSASAGIVYYLNGPNNDLGYEKEVKDNGLVEHKHYLSAGGVVFGMQVVRTGNLATGGPSGTSKPQQSLQYMHHDHLGSVAVVTDATGSVTERLAYDPWGKRRFPNGKPDTTDSIVGLTMDRGFTMHEHLDEMGVIHMNGRIYDPLIGRFMSADPYIQAPDNLQSYNRYAYVMNNPLAFTDPSGYFSWRRFLGRVLFGIAGNSKLGRQLVTIGVCIAGGPVACGFINGANALVSGASLRESIKVGLRSWLTAEAFSWAGQQGTANSVTRYAAHAAVGCASSVASGGGCGSGAASAIFGKVATNNIGGGVPGEWDTGRFIATVVAGGIGSEIGGGKFKNGAATAAYGYLFNELMSRGGVSADERQRQSGYEPTRYKDGTYCLDRCIESGAVESIFPEGYLLGTGGLLKAGFAGLKLSFSGGANSVFWSGYSLGARTTAETLGTTLELTWGGRVLDFAAHRLGIPIPGSVWNWASSTFANNASGTATAVIRAEGRTWTAIEKPILQRNSIPIKYE